MPKRGRSKREQMIREHHLREWCPARLEEKQRRDAAAAAAFQSEQAEYQRQARIRAEAEAAAEALHRQWLDEGMRAYQARNRQSG